LQCRPPLPGRGCAASGGAGYGRKPLIPCPARCAPAGPHRRCPSRRRQWPTRLRRGSGRRCAHVGVPRGENSGSRVRLQARAEVRLDMPMPPRATAFLFALLPTRSARPISCLLCKRSARSRPPSPRALAFWRWRWVRRGRDTLPSLTRASPPAERGVATRPQESSV